jgi:hypothetical protein
MKSGCIICGGVNDSIPMWQTFCTECGRQTWGAAVIASFIEKTADCNERLAKAEATVRDLERRVEELEHELGR